MIGSFKLPISSITNKWQRPSDWLAMPTGITSANETFVGLHSVIENNDNYCAFSFTTSIGQYSVDWGDGTTDLVNSGVLAQHQYNYATYDTSNTTLCSRGYKQAIITVTAVSGNLVTCNFQQRFVTIPIQNQPYSTGFLDCILSMPNASSSGIAFGGTTIRHASVERFDCKTIGGCNNLIGMFYNCYSLQSVPLFNTINATSLISMFYNCLSLQSVPLFNTSSANNMSGMLSSCFSLQSVPLFNTINVTNLSSMFNNCYSLQSVPLFNTSSANNMNSMFGSCLSLQSVPLFNTSSANNMNSMFSNCQSLNFIPNLSTASTTTTSGTDFGNWSGNNSLNRCSMIFARTVNFASCQLSQTALVEIFTNLVDRSATTSATITITGNWGASALTAGEKLIATNKNWVIVN